ncbi:ribonuclease HIII [Ectobacillus polymachus]|uniref:ribonuclease HIII n=1 Tax=Ectobacillus polymachus TaxID=1508806 RepID=UPI003A89172F
MTNHVVIQASHSVIEQMRLHYENNIITKVPQGGIFVAKLPSCTITAYKSGKVLFQGIDGNKEAARWGQSTPPSQKSTKPKANATKFSPPANISTMSIIGSDEVGTGDYFGPITVVAAYVEKTQIPLLKELGVRDSKDLNDTQITAIAKQLIPFLPYSLLVLPNEKYNDLQASGMNQGELKAKLHNQAITNVRKKIAPAQPEATLIDQFVKPEIYYTYLRKQKTVQREQVYFATKGEQIHLAVAAASIIARYAFVKHMNDLGKKAGFVIPKGAGGNVDKAAARLITERGKDSLNQFVKLHFANTEKAMRIAGK